MNPSNLWLVEIAEKSGSDAPEEMRSRHIPRVIKLAGACLLVACFVRAGLWIGQTQHPSSNAHSTALSHKHSDKATEGWSTDAQHSAPSSADTTVTVDVHGDVRRPGLIHVRAGARVADAVKAAGGFVQTADAMYVNQAAVVWDGEEIAIPSAPTQRQMARGIAGTNPGKTWQTTVHLQSSTANVPMTSGGTRIDLNTADLATFETLPGVGPVRANAIINYRSLHGPFTSIRDLLHIRGIGTKTLAKWSGKLYVSQVDPQR